VEAYGGGAVWFVGLRAVGVWGAVCEGFGILIALVPVPTLIAHEVNLGMDLAEECR